MGVLDAGKDVLPFEMGITRQDLVDVPSLTKLTENELDGDSCASDDGLAGKDGRVCRYAVCKIHREPPD